MVKLLAGKHRHGKYATLRMAGGTVGAQAIARFQRAGAASLDVQAVAEDAFTPESWRGFTSLQQLKLSNCDPANLSVLAVLPSLHRLALSNCAVQNEESIAAIRKLTHLSLVGCAVNNWAFLDTLTCGSYLTTLSIAECGGPASLAFASALPQLETLALEGAGATDLSALANRTALPTDFRSMLPPSKIIRLSPC